MALRYAHGPELIRHARPASAFSRGDILVFDSTSSLSRHNELLAGGHLAGVALSASTASINGKVPYLVPQPDTYMWASVNSATASRFTPGTALDVLYANAQGGHYVTTSANTPVVVVANEPVEDLPLHQSVVSQILVKWRDDASAWT